MRDAILVEEIIELMSIARIAAGQNTHSREFAIAAKPPASHDQCIDDCLAHGGKLREGPPGFGPPEGKNLWSVHSCAPGTEECRSPMHHYVPQVITLMR